MREGEVDLKTLGAQEGIAPAYITRVMRLAFLAPEIADALLAGKLPPELDVKALTSPGAVPHVWQVQRETLGILSRRSRTPASA